MNIQLQNLKTRGELGVFYYCLVASDILIGIFNADSRKRVSKFSGLRQFLVFEDLYNGERSLQANKTSKKHQNLNLKQQATSKLQPISLISYLSKKKQKTKSCNKSVKLYSYYSTQECDNSITIYFPFSKRQFPKKSNAVFI